MIINQGSQLTLSSLIFCNYSDAINFKILIIPLKLLQVEEQTSSTDFL